MFFSVCLFVFVSLFLLSYFILSSLLLSSLLSVLFPVFDLCAVYMFVLLVINPFFLSSFLSAARPPYIFLPCSPLPLSPLIRCVYITRMKTKIDTKNRSSPPFPTGNDEGGGGERKL